MYISVRETDNKQDKYISELSLIVSPPPKIQVYLEPVNMTLFRNIVFIDVIRVRWDRSSKNLYMNVYGSFIHNHQKLETT